MLAFAVSSTKFASSSPSPAHDGPIKRRKRGYILTTDQSNTGSHRVQYMQTAPARHLHMTDQSDAGSAGMFSQRTNQTQEAR
eukprot:2269984-Pyramimonas_sp.AAC.1